MVMLRCRRLLCFLIFMLYLYLNSHQYTWYLKETTKCKRNEKELANLKHLAADVHNILEEFRLTHFLCYGSLWGGYRVSNPLPWDTDIDIGLLSDEIKKINHEELIKSFVEKNITIYYRIWLGSYYIERGNARGDLMVFRKTIFNEVWRTGLEPYIFYLHHSWYHRFPAELLEKPLPTVKFAGVEVSVPRGKFLIQKYHYPNDWWMEKKPKGC